MDWQDFKKSDKEVQEELEAHGRSDKQYLDKQVRDMGCCAVLCCALLCSAVLCCALQAVGFAFWHTVVVQY
jgi:diacylglycerol kinase